MRRVTFALAIVALLAAMVLAGCQSAPARQESTQPAATATTMPPAGWHVYRDPGGLFTIQVPDTWSTVSGDARVESVSVKGKAYNAYTASTRDTAFYEPMVDAGNNKDAQLFITVSYTIYDEQDARQYYLCFPTQQENMAFAGLPAYGRHALDGMHPQQLTFATAAALYDISYGVPAEYPGVEANALPSDVPQATVTARDTLAQRILATFVPIPNTPPQC